MCITLQIDGGAEFIIVLPDTSQVVKVARFSNADRHRRRLAKVAELENEETGS